MVFQPKNMQFFDIIYFIMCYSSKKMLRIPKLLHLCLDLSRLVSREGIHEGIQSRKVVAKVGRVIVAQKLLRGKREESSHEKLLCFQGGGGGERSLFYVEALSPVEGLLRAFFYCLLTFKSLLNYILCISFGEKYTFIMQYWDPFWHRKLDL